MAAVRPPRSNLRRTVQTEAGAWGVMKVVNDAFIQPLLISVGASQLALGLYISGSSLFNFGAGWLGPMIAGRVGSTRRFTLISLGISRSIFVLLTAYLLLSGAIHPAVIIALALVWSIFEGFALPMWTSFLTTMVGPHERGRWIAMRAQAATLFTIPVLVGILLLVLFASKERALPIAYGVAAVGAVVSWFTLRRMFDLSPTPKAPTARTLPRLPESGEARQFLTGTFIFWFGSALTWPIIARYLTNDLHAPTAYFAVTQIIGAVIGTLIQPRWGRFGDKAGARRILLFSGMGSSLVPLLWALTPVYWLGFLIDGIAFVVWPGHMLGLTLRAVELVENDDERPMMLGWTNLAQGAGACISPLIAAVALEATTIGVVLTVSFLLRLLASFILSGVIPMYGVRRPEAQAIG